MMKRCAGILAVGAFSIFCVWIAGQIISDRWGWSQWIAWIPTLIVLSACIAALAATRVAAMRTISIVLAVLVIGLTGWIVFVENALLTTGSQTGDLRVVGWTMSHPKQSVSFASAEIIAQLNGDITLLTHGWIVRGEQIIKDWLGEKGHVLISGPFTLLTSLQPIEKRALVASDGIFISQFTLDATPQIGRHVTIWAVDLPSSLSKPRIDTVDRALRLLETIQTTPPDIVIGDFNMTRNSAAMKKLFPSLHDASDDGGLGWLASYPMSFPIYHIDHTLLEESLHAASYKLHSPHIGRHRIQISEIISSN